MSARTLTLRELARVLGGEVTGGGVLCPGPGHSSSDRSLCVRPSDAAADGFVVHSHAGDPFDACRDHVAAVLGLAGDRWRERRPIDPAETARRQEARERAAAQEATKAARNGRVARNLWNEAGPIWGRPPETYLARRGLELFDDLRHALRYHPDCPFGPGHRTPAMVALVRDVRTNEPRAIHRTALTLDGCKAVVGGADRLTLGPVGGGAIKLTPDDDVTLCLGVGEGIESTLSLRRLPEFGASPVWALMTAGGIEAFGPLAGVEALWLAADHDPAGRRAVAACAAVWGARGAETFTVMADEPGADLNDVIPEARRG